jgi:hypothetical protein
MSNPAGIRNYTMNFGPQHPAAHGVLRLVLEYIRVMFDEITRVLNHLMWLGSRGCRPPSSLRELMLGLRLWTATTCNAPPCTIAGHYWAWLLSTSPRH